MLAYFTALDVTAGVLINPRHNIVREDELPIRHNPVVLGETSVDLGGAIPDIELEIDALAQRLRDWSGMRSVAT